MKDGFIKVAACTFKVSVGGVKANKNLILENLDKAQKLGVKLVVFPELSITSYTCQDLFLQTTLLDSVEVALLDIAKRTKAVDCVAIVGAPLRFNNKLYNCAVAIANGMILGVVPKINLPNYSEFYEARHFNSGEKIKNQIINIAGEDVPFGVDLVFSCIGYENFTLGIELCEDLWVINPPSCALAQNGATIIANLSASDEVIGKAEYRKNLVLSQSGRIAAGYIYASAGDGESSQDMVFSGHNIIAEDGSLLKESKLFSNDMIVSEIDVEKLVYERRKQNTYNTNCEELYRKVYFKVNVEKTELTRYISKFPFVPSSKEDRDLRCELILTMQAKGLAKRIEHINCQKLVVGLSGGLDSALALLVMVKALDILKIDRKKILALTMPCFGTTKRTRSNAEILANSLGVDFEEINISKAVKQHFEDIKQSDQVLDVTYENCQARERTQVLMDKANQLGGIVIGTGDLSELALGWATYNGDHMSMYGVNVSIPKTLVRYLVEFYAYDSKNEEVKKVLIDILNTPVSPELLPPKEGEISQKTENIVGPYELHDFYLYYAVRWGFSPKKILRLAEYAFSDYSKEELLKWLKNFYRRFFNNQFKRSCIPDGPKIGTVTLSPRGDWRMPSDAVYSIWLDELECL